MLTFLAVHEWRSATALLALATAVAVTVGRQDLAVPFATSSVTVVVISGLLAGHAAAAVVHSTTPWWAWSAHRHRAPLYGGLTLLTAAVVLVVGMLIESSTAVAAVGRGWLASAGLSWIALGVSRSLVAAGLLPTLVTMANLVLVDPLDPAVQTWSTAFWYGLDGAGAEASAWLVPSLLAAVGAAAVASPPVAALIRRDSAAIDRRA